MFLDGSDGGSWIFGDELFLDSVWWFCKLVRGCVGYWRWWKLCGGLKDYFWGSFLRFWCWVKVEWDRYWDMFCKVCCSGCRWLGFVVYWWSVDSFWIDLGLCYWILCCFVCWVRIFNWLWNWGIFYGLMYVDWWWLSCNGWVCF